MKSQVESGAFSGAGEGQVSIVSGLCVLTFGVEPGAFDMLIKSLTNIPSTQGLLSRP